MAAKGTSTALGEAADIARRLHGQPGDKERQGKLLDELLAVLGRGPDAVTELLTARFEVLRDDFVAQLEHLKEQL